MNDQLDTLTDTQLSEAFAVEVAGYGSASIYYHWYDRKKRDNPIRLHCSSALGGLGTYDAFVDENGTKFYCGQPHRLHHTPRFATSADAVLPFLEKQAHRSAVDHGDGWLISVGYARGGPHYDHAAHAPTFARAACIALIRAKRAEKGQS